MCSTKVNVGSKTLFDGINQLAFDIIALVVLVLEDCLYAYREEQHLDFKWTFRIVLILGIR